MDKAQIHGSGTHDVGVLSLFSHHARQSPEKTALRFSDHSLSYRALLAEVLKFTHVLRHFGVKRGDVVAVSCPRSLSLVPLLLAIWNRGAAYVPIDPGFPEDRKQYVLSDSGAALLFYSGKFTFRYDGHSVCMDTLPQLSAEGADICLADGSADDLAYLIYTSGSTGNPKAVQVSQGNLRNFILAMQARPGIEERDTLLAVTTISFDIHILELFLPIASGATVVVASEEEARSAELLRFLIDAHDVSMMQATPATWNLVLDGVWAPKRPLKILVGGEALPKSLVAPMLQVASELWNMYGPTETTVWSTCYKISDENAEILIGSAIRHTDLYVVDETLHLVPPGSEGELLIGGKGVTLGYKGLPTLSAERFVVLEHLSREPVYRTGDLVVETANGDLRYINRIDNQIKIRGFRIEPGDIETAIDTLAEVTQSCVVCVEFSASDKRLVCFYLGKKLENDAVKKHCRDKLPGYMTPAAFYHLDHFPKTANLKIDRKALIEQAIDLAEDSSLEGPSDARHNLDRSLLNIWKKVLNVNAISIDDNFFDIGGHSLLALTVVEEINRALGSHFSPETIFNWPTIRGLADHKDEHSGVDTYVVTLNKNTDTTPVYCLCGVQIYAEFAAAIQDCYPVHAVFGRQEIAMLKQGDDKGSDFDSEKFLSSYMSAIQRHLKDKKIILAGFSFGGVLAVEIAKKLRDKDIEVEGLILLDSYIPKSVFRSTRKALVDSLEIIREDGWKRFFSLVFKRVKKKIIEKIKSPEIATVSTVEQREEIFDSAAESFNLSASPLNMSALLVKAQKTDFGFGVNIKGDYSWGEQISGDLSIAEYDTDHTGLMTSPVVQTLGNDIVNYLRK